MYVYKIIQFLEALKLSSVGDVLSAKDSVFNGRQCVKVQRFLISLCIYDYYICNLHYSVTSTRLEIPAHRAALAFRSSEFLTQLSLVGTKTVKNITGLTAQYRYILIP